MLQITNLEKKYGNNTILSIPDFCLPTGIYWLKGANGSGKSTLLKIIASLIPFLGEINYNGIDLKKQAILYKQQISYSPADAALPAFLTGLELLQFYNAIRNSDTAEIENIISLFHLESYVQNPTGTYSSGMQKRLAIALAFVGMPKLIMLDEPLSTLDVQSAAMLSSIIQQYQNKGCSFIITSHQDFEYQHIRFTKELLIENQTLTFV